MKNLIVQISINKKGWEEEHRLDSQSDEVLRLSHILVKHYAKINNIEYKLITEPKVNFKHPTWERFQLFDNYWTEEYEHVLYLDTDVFTWPKSPNIFKYLSNDSFNVVTNYYNKQFNNRPMFNAGVFALNKVSRDIMKKYISKKIWIDHFKSDPLWEDSKELNLLTQVSNVKLNWLDHRWNRKNKPDAYFSHLYGILKKTNPNLPSIVLAREIVKKLT